MTTIPEDVAVVLPVRLPKAAILDSELKLENDFSVTILDLPTARRNDLDQVQSRCSKLRRNADALVGESFK